MSWRCAYAHAGCRGRIFTKAADKCRLHLTTTCFCLHKYVPDSFNEHFTSCEPNVSKDEDNFLDNSIVERHQNIRNSMQGNALLNVPNVDYQMKVHEGQTDKVQVYTPSPLLPDVWEKPVHEDGRVLFINHKTKQITWNDQLSSYFDHTNDIE